MKTSRKTAALLPLALAIAIATSAPRATAQSTSDAFQQALTEYQKSLGADVAAKIIRLVAAMEQPPPIPEEARRHFVRGGTLFKDAKTADDLSQAADEFKKATHLAPWWPEARYNYALVLEAAGQYALAINALYLYRAFKLPDAEARAVQDKIYALEAKQEKTAKEKTRMETAERQRLEQEKAAEARRSSFAGGWTYVSALPTGVPIRDKNALVFEKDAFGKIRVTKTTFGYPTDDVRVDGKRITYHSVSDRDSQIVDLTLSDDGKRLTGTHRTFLENAQQRAWAHKNGADRFPENYGTWPVAFERQE